VTYRTLYHITPRSNYRSIKAHGLVSHLRRGLGFAGRGHTESEYEKLYKGTYLAFYPEDILWMADNSYRLEGGPRLWALLRIDLPFNSNITFFNAPEAPMFKGSSSPKDEYHLEQEPAYCWYITRTYIPPKYIKLVGFYDAKTGELS